MDNGAIVASDTERLMRYCPDLENWPRSWSVEPRDIEPGQCVVTCFKPFLLHPLNLGLSRKTLRVHRDNLWVLGGEIIRDLHEDPPLRERAIDELLVNAIDEEGGPLIEHRTCEQQQRSFDSTCRRYYRFLHDTQTR
jgi:hypothetical protein